MIGNQICPSCANSSISPNDIPIEEQRRLDERGRTRCRPSIRGSGRLRVAPHSAATSSGCFGGGLIISWPTQIRNAGSIRHQYGDAADIARTPLVAAGRRFAAVVDGAPQLPVLAALTDRDAST